MRRATSGAFALIASLCAPASMAQTSLEGPMQGGARRTVTVDNDLAMRNAGISLTLSGFGHAGIALGIGASMMADCEGDLCGLPMAVMVYFLAIPGGIVGLVGIPLWIAGEWDVEVPDDDERAREQTARAAPSVTVGPSSVELGWRF